MEEFLHPSDDLNELLPPESQALQSLRGVASPAAPGTNTGVRYGLGTCRRGVRCGLWTKRRRKVKAGRGPDQPIKYSKA